MMKTNLLFPIGLFGLAGAVAAIQSNAGESRANEVSKPFAKFSSKVKTRSDGKNFYVESNGIPDHRMMAGITAWQQQVPLPQNYTGSNAWQFPLYPVEAKEPISAKDHFFRGAIAIAANGIPIFNPIKNDGRTDTFLAGELDEFGGHSGRGDDYHYHIAPLVLQKELGTSLPVAYAVDGDAIYGLTEPDGTSVKSLDSFNGHSTNGLGYHYHATKKYPYINGGFHGQVSEVDGQVDPQPRAESPRPATAPLRGAKITDFTSSKPGTYSLTYSLDGEVYKVNYAVNGDRTVSFEFVDPKGGKTTESYRYRGGGRRGGGDQPERPQGGRPQGQLGPPPGPRKPWFVDHAKELDANKDGEVSKEEVISQCKEAFKGYANGESSIDVTKLPDLPTVRNAIGGFIKVHSKELDRNSDGKITEQEIIESMMRMFDKQDKNHDGKLSGSELEG